MTSIDDTPNAADLTPIRLRQFRGVYPCLSRPKRRMARAAQAVARQPCWDGRLYVGIDGHDTRDEAAALWLFRGRAPVTIDARLKRA